MPKPPPYIRWRNVPESVGGSFQSHHFSSPVTCGHVSPNGEFYVVGEGTKLHTYELLSGNEMSQCILHNDLVEDAKFSPDNRYVLSVGRETNAFIWSVTNGEQVRLLSTHLGWVTCCGWFSSGLQAVTCSSCGIICIWDTMTGILRCTLEGHSGPITTCVTLADHHIITGSEDKLVKIWDVSTRLPVTEINNNCIVNCTAVSFNEKLLAIACDDKICYIWNLSSTTARLRHRLSQHASEVLACCFSPNATEVITCGADRVGIITNVSTGTIIARLVGHAMWIVDVSWNGDNILTCSCDMSIKLWDRQTTATAVDERFNESIMGMRFIEGSGGSQLQVLTKTLRSYIVNLSNMEITADNAPPRGALKYNAGAQYSSVHSCWVFCTYGHSYMLFNGSSVRAVNVDNINFPIKLVRWNPTSSLLLIGGDGDGKLVLIVNVRERRTIASYQSYGWVQDAAWYPDGETAAVSAQTGTFIINVRKPGTIKIGEGSYNVHLSRDCRRLLMLKLTGLAYDLSTNGAEIVDLDSSFAVVKRLSIKDHLLFRDKLGGCCTWAWNDRVVLITSGPMSVYGAPIISAFDSTTGAVLSRFCSPYPSFFTSICVDRGRNEDDDVIVLGDFSGRLFVLSLHNM